MFYIISVIPLTKIKTSGNETLDYFSSQKPSIGGLVLINLGKRQEKAIVLSIKTLKDKKVEIKNAQFKLRPIVKILSESTILNKQQIELAHWISEYYLYSLGTCFRIFLPKSILNRKTIIKDIQIKNSNNDKKTKPVLLWSDDRIEEYKKEIKKAIKNKKQVLFIIPENHNIEIYKDLFDFTVVTSDLSTKEEINIYENVPQLILGTRKSLFLPYNNLGLIILDQEENDSYKSWDQHPKYQTRTTALKMADIHSCKIILGTDLPDVTTYHYASKGFIDLKKNIKENKTPIKIIDLKEEIKKKNYSIFSEELSSKLKNVDSAAIFVNRKGMATSVGCRDCGHIIECNDCKVPMVYYSNPNHLLCHYCKSVKPVPDTCPNCKGFRIKYFGTGIQKAKNRLSKLNIQAQAIDTDAIYDGSKFIVGTQSIFNIKEKFDLGVILLLDPMINRPEYRTMEKAIQTLNNLKKISKEIIIQTYDSENYILEYFSKNNLEDFFKQDIVLRKALDYPPFSRIIKLNFKDKNKERGIKLVNKAKEDLEKLFTKTKILGPSPSFIPRIQGKYSWNIILKTKTKKLTILRNILGPAWEIDVDPQTLI